LFLKNVACPGHLQQPSPKTGSVAGNISSL
jgi:hypothetical protein